jgi:putative transcriptional regulator
MSNLRPSNKQLQQFAEGSIDHVTGLMISAHCDMCPESAQAVVDIEERLAAKVFQDDLTAAPNTDGLAPELSKMLAGIIAQPISQEKPSPPSNTEIELDGRFFTVPRALKGIVDRAGDWSHMVGQLWQTSVPLGDGHKGHFVFLGPDAQVPEHTHKGNELTLVIDGEFKDEYGLYTEGDFIVRSGEHIHSPKTVSKTGCLVFTVVEQPLHFTSGIARLLNPFSHLFFR